MTPELLLNVVEAALLAAGRPLDLVEIQGLFADQSEAPERKQLREALTNLEADLEGRAMELKQVAGGYRLQVREEYSKLLGGLFAERPPRYSRALRETLALIAYRQPVTRGEIEAVRGVAVSGSIIRTLLEREWIRVLGHREVPGRPALYGTTREFLDHFNLKTLEELPPLAEIRDLDKIEPDLFDNIADAQGDQNLAADTALEVGDGEEPAGTSEPAGGSTVIPEDDAVDTSVTVDIDNGADPEIDHRTDSVPPVENEAQIPPALNEEPETGS